MKLASGFCIPEPLPVHTGIKGRQVHPLTPHAAKIPSGSQVISLVRPTGRPAFHSVCHPWIGCRSQDRAPVGASGQLGKEQALPCAENLFSRCGVRLGEYDDMPHGRACPSSAELPEFLQRQECGTTETVSEDPEAYGIRSCTDPYTDL